MSLEKIILAITGIGSTLGIAFCSYITYLSLRAVPIPVCEQIQQGQQIERIVEKNGRKYAVLINATNESRFVEDIRFAHSALQSIRFQSNDIYVLNGDEVKEPFVDYPATKENLKRVLHELEEKITPNDKLFFYVTNDGGFIGGKAIFPRLINGRLTFWKGSESTFRLSDGYITESEFEKMMQNIHPNYIVMYFSQCYGGGFAERLGKGRVIAISNARRSLAYGGEHSFDYNFFVALSGRDEKGNPIDADLDGDGLVSIKKVFDYSVKNDKYANPKWYHNFKETPQLRWQNTDPSKFSFDKNR